MPGSSHQSFPITIVFEKAPTAVMISDVNATKILQNKKKKTTASNINDVRSKRHNISKVKCYRRDHDPKYTPDVGKLRCNRKMAMCSEQSAIVMLQTRAEWEGGEDTEAAGGDGGINNQKKSTNSMAVCWLGSMSALPCLAKSSALSPRWSCRSPICSPFLQSSAKRANEYMEADLFNNILKLALLFLSKGLSRGRCGQVHKCTCTARASFASVASTF